ncbi:MAG TPA: hypothetical protein VK388_14815, partial [Pyrinomonadaceae bacterium]|nr:hypothetical protein [Pyrinomonadaceae bacterium]
QKHDFIHPSSLILHPFPAHHSTRRRVGLTAPYPFATIFAVSYLKDFFARCSRLEIKDHVNRNARQQLSRH